MTFFSRRPQISNFPLFSLFQYIFPLFREIFCFPLSFKNVPIALEKFICILHTLRVFRFAPYFDRYAFMHHPMHVGRLDAPVGG